MKKIINLIKSLFTKNNNTYKWEEITNTDVFGICDVSGIHGNIFGTTSDVSDIWGDVIYFSDSLVKK